MAWGGYQERGVIEAGPYWLGKSSEALAGCMACDGLELHELTMGIAVRIVLGDGIAIAGRLI